jgi:hypothetical protein
MWFTFGEREKEKLSIEEQERYYIVIQVINKRERERHASSYIIQ